MDTKLHVCVHKDKAFHQIPMFLGKCINMTYFVSFLEKKFLLETSFLSKWQ